MSFNQILFDESPTISMYNEVIKPCAMAKYLGIMIDEKLNFNRHTETIKKKTTARASD